MNSLGYPPPSSSSHIKIGDKVRVKASVTTPKYKWGSVTHQSVGLVKGNSQQNALLQTTVSFITICISISFYHAIKSLMNMSEKYSKGQK